MEDKGETMDAEDEERAFKRGKEKHAPSPTKKDRLLTELAEVNEVMEDRDGQRRSSSGPRSFCVNCSQGCCGRHCCH